MCSPGGFYWELVADKVSREGWSWGQVGYRTEDGRQMHAIDASKNGMRDIVNADALLAGFLELEAAIF